MSPQSDWLHMVGSILRREARLWNQASLLLVLAVAPAGGFQLPPEILLDQLVLRSERLIEAGDAEGALAVIGEILDLREEHGLELPPALHLSHARAEFEAGSLLGAKEAVTRYLTVAGREGGFYDAALALLEDVDRILERRDAPDCTGPPEGTECWMELANQSGCHVWNRGLPLEAVAEWTGACASGLATGPGTLSWEWPPANHQEERGAMRLGKPDGHWMIREADGNVGEGPYVDGKRNGHWTWTFPNGEVESGPYVNGQENGHWTWTYPDGQVERGPFVDGKRHGRWVIHPPDGDTFYVTFVRGRRQR